MSEHKEIKISQFAFWLITSVLAIVLAGGCAWINNTTSTLHKVEIELAIISANIINLNGKVDDNLNLNTSLEHLSSNIAIVKNDVKSNKEEYDKFIRPQIDSIILRISTLEKVK